MHRQSHTLTFSPTDLTVFLESEFASWMDRWEADRKALERAGDAAALAAWLAQLPLAADAVPDADLGQAVVAEAGIEHEKKFLLLLNADGKQVLEIPTRSTAEAARQTLDAMRGGAEIIYQARLEAAPFAGWADFLVRRPGDSGLGSWHYEAWDTKLARSTRAKFVVQLCAYSEMLEKAQGRLPDGFEVVLGTGEHRRFVTPGHFFYYLDFKEAFLKFQGDFSPGGMPPPGLAAGFGRWTSYARKLLEATDHLSVVARITRTQVKKLEAAGIHTLAGLLGDERLHVPKLADDKLVELRAQARLQMASRGLDRPLHEVIRAAAEDPRKGLALLPALSPGDVFFDMEGYPLVDGGLEYLFGATTLLASDAGYAFNDWWAHDSSQEKRAFEAFVDWAFERWRRDPSAHIYHYAAYEVSALKRLMGYHATREEKVDDLLRNHVFVDIYTVVRQGLRLGTRSYSLKDVERMCRPKRAGGVTTAAGSMVAYHCWLESGQPQAWEKSPILREIRDYNRVDCESLADLCGWLRAVQDDSGISFIPPPPKAEVEKDADGPAVEEPPAKLLLARLLQEVEAGLPAEPERRRVQQLLAGLLEYHWREAKPVFWRMFNRSEMTETELVEELDCLGALERTAAPPRLIKKSYGHQFRFDPDQDTRLDVGDACFYSHDLAIQV
ncbi:MAG TPA: TM0106 family RecB-like putative nuclease, partial [Planctomycetota bacterium]|nr:TM0106 family RecB-like putative nuclease [Planctomycetota bacterium]